MNEEKFLVSILLACINVLLYVRSSGHGKTRLFIAFSTGWVLSWGYFSLNL